MKKDLETTFTGWTLIASAILLLGGWELLSHHTGEFFVASDFDAIGENLWYWIWMFRFHIFGWVIMGIGMMAFATFLNEKPYRAVLLPGVGVVVVGSFAMALAVAFYYTYGAWGSGKTANMSEEELNVFMASLEVTNQYFTCLERFGRIFSGAGLALFGTGLFIWKIMDNWISIFTLVLGLAAMCVILFIPDNFEVYKPLFYIKVLWLLSIGTMLIRKGVNLPIQE